ncbi:LysR family transcriptional regulator [Mammaliicoccus sp. Dog046]|uniref:LysR family transcriptional regulator n=1 Tax=Mammaliicoccus sp. Dog046 TaxID=3034233 RepID=UPI002B257CD3|nr:LysR family transcriptional regulator [Mammaliicoccus sp. Dog046]WQK85215.1 LysR family transcriptional regulator [Mammaliicoccus sp. Dog046]
MNINFIKTFLVASETKNLSKTASLLNYSQSTVSGHIEKLENELGVTLFHRKKYGIELTNEGLTYVKYAQNIIDSNIEFEKEIKGLYHHSESLAVHMQESQFIYRYADKISKWLIDHPNVNITFKTAHSNFHLKEELSNFETDISLITDEYIINHSLNNIPISEDKLVLVTREPLSTFQLSDIERSTILFTEKGCSYREQMESILFKNNINPMQKIEFLGIESLLLHLKNFGGIALLPQFVVDQQLAENQLHLVPLDYEFTTLKTNLLYNAQTHKESVSSFIESVFSIEL